MYKICILMIFSLILSVCVSACNKQQNSTMVQSQRRLAKYLEPQKENGVVDLSEGPKLKYNANFGPKNPSFDFKIINPY